MIVHQGDYATWTLLRLPHSNKGGAPMHASYDFLPVCKRSPCSVLVSETNLKMFETSSTTISKGSFSAYENEIHVRRWTVGLGMELFFGT
jgi:hypothetical protein